MNKSNSFFLNTFKGKSAISAGKALYIFMYLRTIAIPTKTSGVKRGASQAVQRSS